MQAAGARRARGRVLWEHQHFFPQDWQVQLRAGYVSDATFLEEYFPRDFRDGLCRTIFTCPTTKSRTKPRTVPSAKHSAEAVTRS